MSGVSQQARKRGGTTARNWGSGPPRGQYLARIGPRRLHADATTAAQRRAEGSPEYVDRGRCTARRTNEPARLLVTPYRLTLRSSVIQGDLFLPYAMHGNVQVVDLLQH